MLMQLGKRGTVLFLLFVVLFILACNVPAASTPSSPPAFDATKAVLELQATSMVFAIDTGGIKLTATRSTDQFTLTSTCNP